MKLTKEEAIKRHRELWGWLAENPMKDKSDWPGWDWPGWESYENINSSCFLCEYAFESKKNDFNGLSICDYCPVEFKETNGYPKGTVGYCLGGLFSRWDQAIEPKERSRIASLIRDLPEKKEQSARKFKVGDKVVPVSKSVGYNTYSTYKTVMRIMQENGYEYLIVTRINATFGNSNIVEAENPFSSGYWYFIESDLIPYVERPQNFAPENKTVAISNVKYIFKDSVTVCVITIGGHKYKGIAKCAPDDIFDEEFGKALAETRAYKSAFEDAERTLLGR